MPYFTCSFVCLFFLASDLILLYLYCFPVLILLTGIVRLFCILLWILSVVKEENPCASCTSHMKGNWFWMLFNNAWQQRFSMCPPVGGCSSHMTGVAVSALGGYLNFYLSEQDITKRPLTWADHQNRSSEHTLASHSVINKLILYSPSIKYIKYAINTNYLL